MYWEAGFKGSGIREPIKSKDFAPGQDGFFHYPVGIAVNDENAGRPQIFCGRSW